VPEVVLASQGSLQNVTDHLVDNKAEGSHTGEPGWTQELSQPISENELDRPDLKLKRQKKQT